MLSLPLAFILSQDQTLRCIEIFKNNFLSWPGFREPIIEQAVAAYLFVSSFSYLLNIFNELVIFSNTLNPIFSGESSAKVIQLLTPQKLYQTFF